MNRYSLWQYLLIAVALVFGLLYTLPNLYGEVPAVQVSPLRSPQQADSALMGRVEEALTGLVVPPALFDRLMSEQASFRKHVFWAIARRFGEFQHVVETLAFTGLEARLAAALLKLAGAHGEVEATQEAIAIEIGSAREVVSRQLHQFAERGLVETGSGRVRILAREALDRLAGPAL